jgi:hypothetical protein
MNDRDPDLQPYIPCPDPLSLASLTSWLGLLLSFFAANGRSGNLICSREMWSLYVSNRYSQVSRDSSTTLSYPSPTTTVQSTVVMGRHYFWQRCN